MTDSHFAVQPGPEERPDGYAPGAAPASPNEPREFPCVSNKLRVAALHIWGKSHAVPAEDLALIENHLRRFEREKNDAAFEIDLLLRAELVYVACLFGLVAFVAFGVNWTLGRVGWFVLGYGLGLGLYILALAIVLRGKSDRLKDWCFLAFPLVMSVVAGLLAYWWTGHQSSQANWQWSLTIIIGVAAAGVTLEIALFVTFVPALVIFHIRQKRLRRRLADTGLVLQLTDALLILDAINDSAWQAMANRQHIAEHLESAAQACSILDFRSGREDYATAVWLKGQRASIVGNIRQLKRWVFTPRLNTKQELVDRLGRDVIAAARGSLGELCRNPVQGVPRSKRFSALLINGRTFIASLIPLGVVLLLANREVVTGAAVTPLLLVTFLVPGIVVIRLLDPSVLEDLKAAQDFLLPSWGERSRKSK